MTSPPTDAAASKTPTDNGSVDQASSTAAPASSSTSAASSVSAATTALAAPSPSRLSRAAVSPVRPSGLLAPQRSSRSIQSAASVAAASVESGLISSASGDEEESKARTSVDHSEYPPARRSPVKAREALADGTQTLAVPQRPTTGVDFLTRRLRSAIGQDLLRDGSESESDNEAVGGVSAAALLGSIHVERPSRQAKKEEGGKLTADEASTSQASNDSQATAGWRWSTLTTLPNSLRLDNALQSLSFLGDRTQQEPTSTANVDTGKAAEASTSTSPPSSETASSLTGYISALDARKWFAPATPSSSTSSSAASASTATERAPPPMPSSALKNLPVGSFPVSGTKKKSRTDKPTETTKPKVESADPPQTAGSDVEEHDLSNEAFGSAGDDGVAFAPHEYLVLSTAGKPVYWSKVSKARLQRSRVSRTRKREQLALLEKQKADGKDTGADEAAFAQREEQFAKEEQDEQNEEDQVEATRVGLLQAIISNYAESDKEKLHSTANEVLGLSSHGRVCFLLRPPLYLVAVSRWDEAEATLRNHLDYLYQAIISLVSATKLNRLFDRAANFDLKRLLQGTDNILDALLTHLHGETIAMRGALQPLRLDAALRHDVGAALIPARSKSRPQDALYALLLTRKGIVTLARRRKHSIHPLDCHLLINTVLATKALKEGGTQSWVPICLPKFAPQGFVYAHVSFLDAELRAPSQPAATTSSSHGTTRRPELGLVLVTGNPDGFDDMSAWRERIVGMLKQQDGLLRKLLRTTRTFAVDENAEHDEHTDLYTSAGGEDGLPHSASNSTITPATTLSAGYSADELGLPGLRHFCFKWRSNVQSTSPAFEVPYIDGSTDHQRLLYLYGLAHNYVARSNKVAAEERKAAESDAVPALSDTASETDASSRASASERRRATATRGRAKASSPAPATAPAPVMPRSVLASSAKRVVEAVTPSASSVTCTHLLRTQSEAVVAWSTPPFELYMCASPHLPRAALLSMARAVVKWVKQEEHRLFIVSAPVF